MNASGRRYRQAKQKFNHLTPRQRPNYRMRDVATATRHNEAMLRRERERIQRKGNKS